jgi:hypothetical protein
MAVTATATQSIKKALNSGDPALQATGLNKIKFGDMLEPVDETIVVTAAAAVVLSVSSALKRAAMVVQSVRVIAGVAALGPRTITDAGGTATATACKLGVDGDTLTFEATVTSIRVVWIPRASVDPDTVLAAGNDR